MDKAPDRTPREAAIHAMGLAYTHEDGETAALLITEGLMWAMLEMAAAIDRQTRAYRLGRFPDAS